MSTVPFEKPKNLNDAIALYWQEKHAYDAAKDREKQSREWLADLMCMADDDYKNKTLDLSGGWKLKLDVKRKIRVDKTDDRYKQLPNQIVPRSDFSATEFNKFCAVTQVLEHSLTGYRALPQRIKDYLGAAAQEVPSFTIKFEPPKDDR